MAFIVTGTKASMFSTQGSGSNSNVYSLPRWCRYHKRLAWLSWKKEWICPMKTLGYFKVLPSSKSATKSPTSKEQLSPSFLVSILALEVLACTNSVARDIAPCFFWFAVRRSQVAWDCFTVCLRADAMESFKLSLHSLQQEQKNKRNTLGLMYY